ncbi:hypothetical protein GTZ89_01155, partial [Streptomyces sp. SID8382]|uniref:hypothetical protein n=1 Tax=Streptomyces malaysiensis TaxID=92644 RepID=UPI0013FF016F
AQHPAAGAPTTRSPTHPAPTPLHTSRTPTGLVTPVRRDPEGARGCVDMRLRRVGATSHDGAPKGRGELRDQPRRRGGRSTACLGTPGGAPERARSAALRWRPEEARGCADMRLRRAGAASHNRAADDRPQTRGTHRRQTKGTPSGAPTRGTA